MNDKQNYCNPSQTTRCEEYCSNYFFPSLLQKRNAIASIVKNTPKYFSIVNITIVFCIKIHVHEKVLLQ